MNIGFIEDTHLHGGTQLWAVEAMKAFIDRGHEVTLLAPADSWIVEQCRAVEAAVYTYDWDDVVGESGDHINRWTEALIQCDVALCTVHPPRKSFHCSVFAARCIKKAGLKTHLIPKTGTIVPEYERRFYRPDESINSSIIAIADFTRQYLIETYQISEKHINLIYQGVDTRRFRSTPGGGEKALKQYPIPGSAGPLLASVGSFEHRKGQPILFDAVAKLAAGPLPEIHLMMVGDGPDDKLLRSMVIDLDIQEQVSFFPFTSQPNLVFEVADITVLPSLYKEGLPNVLQESMAMETPVVSSNLGGVPEIVIDGETGFMVEPGNSSQLAEAILKLWSDPAAYKGMSQKARQLITGRFDKEHQFDQFIEHFKYLIGLQAQIRSEQ